jgi:hypothetical protein
MRDFIDLVGEKTFEKMPYKLWKDLDRAGKDPDTHNVRIYWDTSHNSEVEITIVFDRLGENSVDFEFSNGDFSFGDFLYENYLYGPEMDMRLERKADYMEYCDSSRDYHWYSDTAGVTISNAKKCEHNLDYCNLGETAALESPITEVVNTLATKADVCILNETQAEIKSLRAEIAQASPMKNHVFNLNTENKKENNIMKFNFDFGPVNASMVRMSLYGLAVKNKAGTWVSYDAKAGDIMDVDILNFDGAKFLYKMPVAIKDIAIGDVVIHNGIPMFVIAIATNGAYITAVDPINGERKDIMLPKSPFGFNFATKVVNFLGNLDTGADASNPFGNLGLMLMLNDNKDMGDLLPLMLMTGNSGLDMSNPLMLYALMGNDSKSGNDNLLPLMLMMNANKPAAPAHECKCGGHCGENHGQN